MRSMSYKTRRGGRRAARCGHAVLGSVVLGSVVLLAAGCSGLTDVARNTALPSGVVDPASFKTPEGALSMYRAAVTQFQAAFLLTQSYSGLLTDELETVAKATGGGAGRADHVDSRRLPENDRASGFFVDPVYGKLQLVRTYAVQATGALAKYNPHAPVALRGEVLALAGYAELYLADLYCSGVPLSTLEFEGDFTPAARSTTAEVYLHAITQFDSALTLAGDSVRILSLARVGKGRALLALGRYAEAAQAVAQVPDDFQDQFPVVWTMIDPPSDVAGLSGLAAISSVADREGQTGLAFRSGGDPRTATDTVRVAGAVGPTYFPVKYKLTPVTTAISCAFREPCSGYAAPVTVASGIEARLIAAEAALHTDSAPGGRHWLDLLNQLRATATVPGMTGPLPALSDPGAWAARVDTLFAERAKWLFVDGHRQGDLRRLIRQYGRRQNQVYPTGSYGLMGDPPQLTPYGSDVTFPVPTTEAAANPLFKGCFSRGA